MWYSIGGSSLFGDFLRTRRSMAFEAITTTKPQATGTSTQAKAYAIVISTRSR
jgi:hypothetical protein